MALDVFFLNYCMIEQYFFIKVIIDNCEFSVFVNGICEVNPWISKKVHNQLINEYQQDCHDQIRLLTH